ncbi:MAG: phosphoribosyl-AMP cyclohydrolase / phosphoribosyl-ATP pyrophosphohydrolase [Clostridia bacterium]|jgi:phosphoribosyl-ATP pyrophosphohydrolase/phosphoribosyl-AMP cyclohydrolase|nr:phosphoribosyl-AMP cyclohydrolase / phosphoribosyl-ATP pyrophosphohydrolase [Clostridia bacterium]
MVRLEVTSIKWNSDNLIPAILQDYLTGKVLMMAYMNKEALEKTIATKEAWFWSRSRKTLWHKGGTSGNVQKVISIALDCDYDTLLVQVDPRGPACHLGTESCFGEGSNLLLENLIKIIEQRYQERPEKSYTTYLFNEGIDKILKKVGEEAAEVIIAAKNNTKKELAQESADLLYHLFVLFKEKDIDYRQILEVLKERRG